MMPDLPISAITALSTRPTSERVAFRSGTHGDGGLRDAHELESCDLDDRSEVLAGKGV
jgi:hypothetical protein